MSNAHALTPDHESIEDYCKERQLYFNNLKVVIRVAVKQHHMATQSLSSLNPDLGPQGRVIEAPVAL